MLAPGLVAGVSPVVAGTAAVATEVVSTVAGTAVIGDLVAVRAGNWPGEVAPVTGPVGVAPFPGGVVASLVPEQAASKLADAAILPVRARAFKNLRL